ncbi:Retrovirus-related Pol polyprotein from transposon RE1 [Vitis vinifera]|uniref:Retrovirus-related Pol polyprotein from transposon RE1 n=1 Tax=Vitis vinifera TaxID=29760 RepID=A0A438CV43_VITVI|nr:Retrovirus-related Pol polyprotein from transposon RE1 [Vitis vinifera]
MPAMVASQTPKNSETWFFDIRATHHLAQDIETLSDVQAYKGNKQVIVGNDQVLRQVLLQGQLKNGLYEFPHLTDDAPIVFYTPTMLNITSSLWHSRLGHPTDDILTKALNSFNIAYQRNKRAVCSACPVAKSHKLPFSLSNSRSVHPLALIHTDLWGPAPTPSTTGYSPTHKGYMCFDSNSNCTYITRHVKFHETKFPFQQTVNTSFASSSYHFMSPPALLPVPLSIPPTQTSQSLVPTSQSPHLSNYAHSCHSSHNSASLIPIPNPIPVPFTASSSSSLTNPSAPHNSHAMITRAKTGIFKKKLRLAYKPIEPYSFQQASKDPNWVSAMETEYEVSYRTIPSS